MSRRVIMVNLVSDYGPIAEDYNRKRRGPWRPFAEFMESAVAEGRIVDGKGIWADIGCGTGRHSSYLGRLFGKCIAVDYSIEMLFTAKIGRRDGRKENKTFSNIRVHFICGDMRKLPLRKNILNGFISVAAVHHLTSVKDVSEFLKSSRSALKDNGIAVITVWSYFSGKHGFSLRKKIYTVSMTDLPLYVRLPERLHDPEMIVPYLPPKTLMIPWRRSDCKKTGVRYYRLYTLHFSELFGCYFGNAVIHKKDVGKGGKHGIFRNYFFIGIK